MDVVVVQKISTSHEMGTTSVKFVAMIPNLMELIKFQAWTNYTLHFHPHSRINNTKMKCSCSNTRDAIAEKHLEITAFYISMLRYGMLFVLYAIIFECYDML